MNDNIKFQFKIIIVGNTNTGKTCFLHQFIEKKCKFFIKLKLTQTIQQELSLEQKFQKILESNYRFGILQVKKGIRHQAPHFTEGLKPAFQCMTLPTQALSIIWQHGNKIFWIKLYQRTRQTFLFLCLEIKKTRKMNGRSVSSRQKIGLRSQVIYPGRKHLRSIPCASKRLLTKQRTLCCAIHLSHQ